MIAQANPDVDRRRAWNPLETKENLLDRIVPAAVAFHRREQPDDRRRHIRRDHIHAVEEAQRGGGDLVVGEQQQPEQGPDIGTQVQGAWKPASMRQRKQTVRPAIPGASMGQRESAGRSTGTCQFCSDDENIGDEGCPGWE